MVGQVVRRLGVSEQTSYRWPRELGGMRVGQAKRLKELEPENARLKLLVAEQALDNSVLRERWPREASEPGEATPGGRTCAGRATRLGTPGLQRRRSGAGDPALRAEGIAG